MAKNRIIFKTLQIVSGICVVTLIGWATIKPLMATREATTLTDEARQVLSPPIKGLTDIDSVDCDRAREMLSRALELAPNNGAARRELSLAEGCSALQRGDLILAEGGLRAAVRRMPSDPRPHRWLGTLALAQDRPEDGRRHFLDGLELDSDSLPLRIGLADALADLGRLEEALETLDAVGGSPSAIIETRRGMIFEQLDRVDEARHAYRQAIELAPQTTSPRNNLAALERDQGDLELAWQIQSEALALAPNDPLLLLNTGLLAIARGHDSEALELLRRSAELERTTPDPARALADQLLVMGNVEEALQVLDGAIGLFPRHGALLNSLGNALAAARRPEEARQAYRRATRAAPELAEPHNGLAAISMAEGDLDQAERELRRALEIDPEHVQALRNLRELERRRRSRPLQVAQFSSHHRLSNRAR